MEVTQQKTHFNNFFRAGQLKIKFGAIFSLLEDELAPLIPDELPTIETAAAAEERETESRIASLRRSNPKNKKEVRRK